MAVAKLYCTTSSRLPDLAVSNGNMIFVSDMQTLYLDFNGSRIPYNGVKTFLTEGERIGLLSPAEGWYYVEETSVVWRYKDKIWTQITPSDIEPIYFGGESTFPREGVPNKLYVAEDCIYKWDSTTQKYVVVANSTAWVNIEEKDDTV